jgi:hypothetical protein
MHKALPRAAALLAAAGLAALFALGAGADRPGYAVRGGPPPARTWRQDCAGKPLPAVGHVELTVADRPAFDEVVLRADWTAGSLALEGPASLELVLPEDAWLVDGEPRVALAPGFASGVSTWTVRFRADRTLDAAVRLEVERGDDVQRREFYARLWEVPSRERN